MGAGSWKPHGKLQSLTVAKRPLGQRVSTQTTFFFSQSVHRPTVQSHCPTPKNENGLHTHSSTHVRADIRTLQPTWRVAMSWGSSSSLSAGTGPFRFLGLVLVRSLPGLALTMLRSMGF